MAFIHLINHLQVQLQFVSRKKKHLAGKTSVDTLQMSGIRHHEFLILQRAIRSENVKYISLI